MRDHAIPVVVESLFSLSHGSVLELELSDSQWTSTVRLGTDVIPRLNGTLRIAFAANTLPQHLVGSTYRLFDWQSRLDPKSRFAVIEVPAGSRWDLSRLYDTGEVAFLAVPEPSSMSLVALVSLLGGGYHATRSRFSTHRRSKFLRFVLF